MAAGFDEFTAHRLASNAMVDVHALIVTQERSRSGDPRWRSRVGLR